ncbi:MAG: putative phage repressor [Bradyrhizobium sp.]|nr:putative phage repressor [Bradyrhizobium sp.]
MANQIHDRIRQAVEAQGISLEAAAKNAGLDRGYFQKLFDRDSAPRSDTMKKLANSLNISEVWLLTGKGSSLADAVTEVMAGDEPVTRPPNDGRIDKAAMIPNSFDLPKNVEVKGTAAGSHIKGAFQFSGGTIDYVRRPPALMGARDVYALYVEGSSMEPQFFPGDLLYIHPHKPARVGDPVVIQSKVGSDHEIEATIGIYLRKTEKHVVIGKHNPKAEIQILRDAGTEIHKIMTLNELFGV